MTDLLPVEPGSSLQHKGQRPALDLADLVEVYFTTQVDGSAANTVKAKRRDLDRFLAFYRGHYGHADPRGWFPAVTKAWLRDLMRQIRDDGSPAYSPATIARIYASVRHFARWLAGQMEFPAGAPTDGVKPPPEPEGDWKGLERKNQLRLVTAAQMLGSKRDLALLHSLLGSGLRVSELLAVDLVQWSGQGFRNVLGKGDQRRDFVRLWGADARRAVEAWTEERGPSPGPLFTTRTGQRLHRSQAWRIVQRIQKQANAQLDGAERFTVSPHILRHALLRRLTEEKGEHVARKQSGHRSSKYLYRYVQPADADLAQLDDFE